MKKLVYSLIIALSVLFVATPVSAKNQDVSITEAAATANSVTVKGTTEAIAIIVQVRDSRDEIVEMQSFGTTDKAFDITISNLSLSTGSYMVYVADYEGGSWATMAVEVKSSGGTGGNGGSTGGGTGGTGGTSGGGVPTPTEPAKDEEITHTNKTDEDGTVTDTTTVKKPDGTESVTQIITKPDGETSESVTVTKPDGEINESVTVTKPDGETKETVTVTSPDGSVDETKTTTTADGKTKTTTEISYDSDGTIVDSSISVEQITTNNTTKVDLNAFEEAAKQVSSNTNVTITLKDSSGTVQSTVSVTCKDLTQDGVLKVFKVDASGNFIMTDGKKNTAAIKDDELQLKLDASGNYELVTKKQGKAIEKKILASVKPKKKSETIHKGKSFRFEFAKGFNKKNIEKITYSTKDTIVKVSKNGKIKALAKGEATVTVTVKLVNGKTKTLKLKITVK